MSAARLLDAILRVVFFAGAPVVLVRLATLVPITGTLVDVALALALLLAGERVRPHAERHRALRFVFGTAFAFDAHYQEHPPKPFLYYVFYPLLFPYWLTNRAARREFLLFKGYTLLSLGVLVATNLYDFIFRFQPELGLREFVRPFVTGLLIESVAVLALLMPLVTTAYALHRAKARRLLSTLLALGALSSAFGIGRLVVRHAPIVSLATRERLAMRTAKRRPLAINAMAEGLRRARAAQHDRPAALASDGAAAGAPVDAAREGLGTFYRSDEAKAFELWMSGERVPQLVVLFAEGRTDRPPIWLGMRADGSTVGDARQLPRPARRAMKEVGQF